MSAALPAPTNPLVPARPPRKLSVALVQRLLDHLLDRSTEGGFVAWFFAFCADDVRYIVEYKTWAMWDGRRWMIDGADAIRERAKESVQAILDMLPREPNKEKQKAILRLFQRYDNVDRIKKMLDYARTDPRVVTSMHDYDCDPWLLNCANGTVDLRTGHLLVPQRADMITKILEIPYAQQADAPAWRAFLQRIMQGHPEMIPFLQRAVGYSLTGSTREQCFFVLHGTGRNAKSTFVETLLSMLGEYGQTSNPESWLKQSGGRNAEPDIARLPGVRMVTSAELGEGRAIDEARIKQITGVDRIATRNLYEREFEFLPACKLWISTNHEPTIKGTDDGMWRRVRLVPFAETISYEEMDREMPAKLREDLPGILAWAVQGCLAWQDGGLAMPEIVRATTAEYRTEQDIVGQFVDACCVREKEAREAGSVLYASYAEWARVRGERPFNATLFGRRLGALRFTREKIGGTVWRNGLRVRPPGPEGLQPSA